MEAIVLEGTEVRHVSDHPEPVALAGEVVCDVLLAGICETDVQLAKGYLGFRGIPGHEFVARPRYGRFAGRRVVGEINCACHRCPTCQAGAPTHCPHRTVLGILNHNGAFAERVAIPDANLHALPDAITDDRAVFVEPVAAAFQILEQYKLHGKERVVVLGDGRLGNLCAQVLKLAGGNVTIVGKHAHKLHIAGDLGLGTLDRANAVPDRGADLVVDCTGSPTGLADAFAWVRPRGTIALKTTVAANHTLSLAPIVIDEIRLIGSRCGPFPPAIAALADGSVRVEPLVDRVVSLAEVPAAIHETATGNGLKTLIRIAPDS